MASHPLFLATAIEAVRRAGDLQMARFGGDMQIDKKGTIDLVTVLNTQTALFQAQDLLAQNALDRLQALVGLFQALGGGWKKPKDELTANLGPNRRARP